MLYQIKNLFKIQSHEEINMYSEVKRMGGVVVLSSPLP
jgi:hypothetical protein